MMDNLVYIIIPVYNREKLIRPCLDSVLCQTYENIRIIIIDDGSTDDSGAICDEYASKDSRFIVVHQNNSGIAGARNAGLDAVFARDDCDYIMFLDSDDILEPIALERIVEIANRNDADIVQWQANDFNSKDDDVWYISDNRQRYDKSFDIDAYSFEDSEHCEVVTDSKGALTTLLDTKNIGADSRFHLLWNNCRCVWTKCCKKHVYEGVRCPDEKSYEDDFIVDALFMNAATIVFINDSLTNYRVHSSNFLKKSNLKDKFDHTECERERFKHVLTFEDDGLTTLAAHDVIMSSVNSYVFSVEENTPDKTVLEQMKLLLDKYVSHMSKADKLVYYGFNVWPRMMYFIYKYYRARKGW